MYRDVEKRRLYRRRWYYRNKEKSKIAVKRRKNEMKVWYVNLKKDRCCSKCEEADYRCLDFHHLNGDKFKWVSQMMAEGYGKDSILEEIAKCVVLCANCHRKETISFHKE